MTALLTINGLNAWYGETQALYDVSLAIPSGGITVLLGANGAGKTTTLRAICNSLRREGQIMLGERDLGKLPTEDIVRLGIAHVPEGRGTFTALSVEENLRIAAYTRKDKSEIRSDLERIFGYFPKLKERIQQQAGTLSGGEQQMLAIARAILLKPRLMLLDEPSFGLAPRVIADIFRILKRINQEEKVGVLLVEQNASLALELADQVYVLETGRIVMSGTSQSMIADDRIRKSYLGY